MARGSRNVIPIKLGPLNVSIPEHTGPDGILRAVKNLIPLGDPSSWFWGVANRSVQRGSQSGVLGIVAHQRGLIGDLSDLVGDANQTHERLIILTDDELYIVDPGQAFSSKSVFTFSSADTDRKMQGAQLGEHMYLTITESPPATGVPFAEQGYPTAVKEVRDDVVLSMKPVDRPQLTVTSGVTAVTDQNIERKLEPGRYAYRFAFRYRDGSVGAPSVPHFITIGLDLTTISAAVSKGDTQFTVTNIDSFITGFIEAGEAGNDQGIVYVGTETLEWESFNTSTGVVTLKTGTQFYQDHAVFTGVDLNRGYWIKFQFGAALTANWDDVITGMQISMSQKVVNDEDALRNPYYDVVQIEGVVPADASVYFSETNDLISGYPVLDETLLTAHEIGAGAVFAYNSRLHLGDITTDFAKPEFVFDMGIGTQGVRFGVKIETANGEFIRISDGGPVDSLNVKVVDNMFIYPDVRATEFYIYVEDSPGSGMYVLGATLKPKKSSVLNIAYYQADGPITCTVSATVMPDVDTVNAENDRTPNTFYVSDIFQPRSLRAANVFEVGESNNDPVIGFAVNSLAVSEGQFGQFPLIVLSNETVSIMSVGSGGLIYSNVQRIANRGCVGRYAFATVESRVYFASRDGIWAIGPLISEDAVSASIHYHYNANDLFGCLDNDTCLGYYNDTTRGRRELWVGAGKLVFGFSEIHGTWFILDRSRRAFCLLNGILYGASDTDDGEKLYDEGASTDTIDYYLRTNRLTLGSPGQVKRIHHLAIKQTVSVSQLDFRMRDTQEDGSNVTVVSGSILSGQVDGENFQDGFAVAPMFEVWGLGRPGEGMVAITVEASVRAAGRARENVPLPAVLSGGVIDVSDQPWTCSEGFSTTGGGDDAEIPTGYPEYDTVVFANGATVQQVPMGGGAITDFADGNGLAFPYLRCMAVQRGTPNVVYTIKNQNTGVLKDEVWKHTEGLTGSVLVEMDNAISSSGASGCFFRQESSLLYILHGESGAGFPRVSTCQSDGTYVSLYTDLDPEIFDDISAGAIYIKDSSYFLAGPGNPEQLCSFPVLSASDAGLITSRPDFVSFNPSAIILKLQWSARQQKWYYLVGGQIFRADADFSSPVSVISPTVGVNDFVLYERGLEIYFGAGGGVYKFSIDVLDSALPLGSGSPDQVTSSGTVNCLDLIMAN